MEGELCFNFNRYSCVAKQSDNYLWATFVIMFCNLIFFLRWMDGTFLELDGESMETEIDEFYREMYKLLRLFQQKQKKAAVEKKKAVRYIAGRGHPTLTMCSSILDQIKEFKVRKREGYSYLILRDKC